ncbi:MAG: hypothetical protein A2049_05360 [Elusimicrobia bacterium GWA2_62_23]|nr:MAG: hypothetical protein A2049_05360 [Elusimicrobia bacterium GWA2_62_23]
MPRISRAVGVGLPHHVTQRGNYGGVVFESDFDRNKYLDLVSECSSRSGLSILGYCLMPNHVHFIAVPGNADSLADTFKIAHARYAQYLNWKRHMKGHLWQGRFYSCVLDVAHLRAAGRYVEKNPVRAGLVGSADMWEWSSVGAHLGRVENKYGFDLDAMWSFIPEMKRDWGDFLSLQYETEADELIRANTRTGRPMCDTAFMRMLENRLGRRLRARHIGRPNSAEAVDDYCFLGK